jgi:hypothetical protein
MTKRKKEKKKKARKSAFLKKDPPLDRQSRAP